jgi:hypothetical protein
MRFNESRFRRGITASCVVLMSAAACADSSHLPGRSEYRAPESTVEITIDGIADDAVWATAPWRDLDQRWLGPEHTAADFEGRFKVAWTRDRLIILAEFTDDILIDTHRDPLVQYWDDDCLEIFIDEDFSGGEHHYNHNAFAYHLSLDNQAIDIGTDQKARNYSHHVDSRWRQDGDKVTWEVAIEIYDDTYEDDSDDNTPVVLTAGKLMGLMIAYCDNDGSELRENFIGSEEIAEGPKDRGYIDAGVFGSLVLVEAL